MNPHPLRVSLIVAALAMLAPFSLDTYLPSFPDIAADLAATNQDMQRTLSDYLWAFGAMMLVYGPLSDALGRRRVVLLALLGYALASLGCALAQSIDILVLMRIGQGMAAGAGLVIGRALVRDVFDGAKAQKVTADVMLFFAIAPAIAPLVGGWLDDAFGWRAVFLFLAGMGLLIFALVAAWMPETLPKEQRQPIQPQSIALAYAEMLKSLPFMLLAVLFGLNFGGLFIYIASAPELIYEHLGYGAHDFWRLFVPVVAGIVLGSFLSGRLANRLTSHQGVSIGFVLMAIAALFNVALTHLPTATAFTLIAPVALYAVGMSFSMPGLSLLGLDMYPARRGMASAMQGFMQMTSNGLLAAFVVTLLVVNVQWLALGQLGIAMSALGLWLLFLKVGSKESVHGA
ncbi:MAG: multidrug effflux MFS transporter [Halothiobacillaceae bacterium]